MTSVGKSESAKGDDALMMIESATYDVMSDSGGGGDNFLHVEGGEHKQKHIYPILTIIFG